MPDPGEDYSHEGIGRFKVVPEPHLHGLPTFPQKEEASKPTTCRIVTGRVFLRDDGGPSGKMGDLKQYLELSGPDSIAYYDLDFLLGVPGVLPQQIALMVV